MSDRPDSWGFDEDKIHRPELGEINVAKSNKPDSWGIDEDKIDSPEPRSISK